MKIYIAGPMTSYPEFNRPTFFAADKVLKAMGHEPVNPADADKGKSDGPWNGYLKRDIPLMLECQGIVLLPGWQKSKGAKLELHIAQELGLLAFELVDNEIRALKFNPLEEAGRIVNHDRQDAYGHPYDDFSRCAKIWSAILGKEVTPQQVSLCMIGLKISREVNGHKDDNITDGIGYWLTLNMVCEREAELVGRERATAASHVFDAFRYALMSVEKEKKNAVHKSKRTRKV